MTSALFAAILAKRVVHTLFRTLDSFVARRTLTLAAVRVTRRVVFTLTLLVTVLTPQSCLAPYNHTVYLLIAGNRL